MDSKKHCSRDAISLLPDEMLSNILSSLPTKHAASTSLLSKRWRNVFSLVHNLDFDDSVLGEAEFPKTFESFVDTTLTLQRDYPIKKFSLKCHLGKDNENQKACVSRWISNAVERGVLELDLKITDRGLQFMSPQLLSCKTLVKLRLGTELIMHKLPSNVYLPSLKTLFIDIVNFEYGDFSGVLLAGCPMLEDLSVHHNKFPGIPQTISSSTVKRLSMKCDSIPDVDSWCPLSFVLPKLIYLEYSHSALSTYPQVNLESLVEAKLDLYRKAFYEFVWSPDVTNLIFGLRNVEILHLSSTTVDVIYCYCRYKPNLLVFNNLVELSFGSKTKRGWELLPYLLKHSPKLQTLIIEDLNDNISYDVSMQLNKVKVLHIVNYYGTDEEMRHLKSFLWKTESLELVRVDVIVKDESVIVETTRRLMMRLGVTLPSNCQIKVSHKLVA